MQRTPVSRVGGAYTRETLHSGSDSPDESPPTHVPIAGRAFGSGVGDDKGGHLELQAFSPSSGHFSVGDFGDGVDQSPGDRFGRGLNGKAGIPASLSSGNIGGGSGLNLNLNANMNASANANANADDDLFDGGGNASVQGSLTTKGFESKSAGRFERGVFGLFYTMVKDRPQHRIFSRLLVPLKLLQFLAFSFNTDFPWNPDMTHWFQLFLRWSQFNFSKNGSYASQVVYFGLASVSLYASYANFVYVMYMFQSAVITNVWSIRMLRVVAGTLFTFLFIPITRILLLNVKCDYSGGIFDARLTDHPDVYCFGWPNAFLYVVSVVALLCLIPLALMTSLVYYDGDIKSKDVQRRHHGRLDFLLLIMKLVLVFSEVLFSDKMGIRIACLMISSLVYLLACLVFQPYYHQRTNNTMVGMFSVVLLSAICTAICYGIGDSDSVVAPALFFALAIPSFYGGFVLSRFRYNILVESVRQTFPESHPGPSAVSPNSHSQGPSAFFFESDVEIAIRHLIVSDHPNLSYAQKLYLIGVKLYPQSTYILQSYILFIAYVKKNFPLTIKPIRALRRLDLMLDTKFLIYVVEVDWTKSNHSQELGDGGTMDVMHYVDFQSNYNRAKTYHVKTRKLIQTFWEKVIDSTDEHFVIELPQLASDIVRNEKKCEESYIKLLDTYPESRVLLRSFGQFVETVKNDKEWAREYYSQADALEDPSLAAKQRDETSSYHSHVSVHKQRSQSAWIKKRDRAKLEVVRLLQVGTYVIGFTICLATIAVFTLGRISHIHLSDILTSASELSESSKYSQVPFLYLRSLGLSASNKESETFTSNQTVIEEEMSYFLSLQQTLYDSASRVKLSPDWTRSEYTVYELLPTSYYEFHSNLVNFWDGANSYIQRTRFDSYRSMSQFEETPISNDYWFVLNNGPAAINEMFSQMRMSYEARHESQLSYWHNVFSVLLGASFGLNIAFQIFFVRTLEKLQLFREKTLNIFLVIPKPVISDLLQTLRNARDEEDEDDERDHHELETINESQENVGQADIPHSGSIYSAHAGSTGALNVRRNSQSPDDGAQDEEDGGGKPGAQISVDSDVEKDILQSNKSGAYKSKKRQSVALNEPPADAANIPTIEEKSSVVKRKKDQKIHARHHIGLFIVQLTFLAIILTPYFMIKEQSSFVKEVSAAGYRWELMTRIRFFSREYVLGNSQFWTRSEIQKILNTDAKRLGVIHNQLKYGGGNLPGSDHRYEPQHSLLYDPVDCLMLNRTFCVPGRIPGFVSVSLDSLMKRFVSKAVRLSAYPVNTTELSLGQEDFAFLWAAGETDLNDGLHKSLLLYNEEGQKKLDDMVNTINGVFAGSICTLILIYFALLRPITVYLREESENITRILSIIPQEWESRPLIEWSEKLSVGITIMDNQHKVLLNLINAYYRAVLDLKGAEVIGKVLDALLQYTVKHFGEEEALLSDQHYPALDGHKELHRKLIGQVMEFVARLKKGDPSVDFRLMTFLRAWLTSHILGHDKKYGRFLLQNGYENEDA